jgi:hypothetical protein
MTIAQIVGGRRVACWSPYVNAYYKRSDYKVRSYIAERYKARVADGTRRHVYPDSQSLVARLRSSGELFKEGDS